MDNSGSSNVDNDGCEWRGRKRRHAFGRERGTSSSPIFISVFQRPTPCRTKNSGAFLQRRRLGLAPSRRRQARVIEKRSTSFLWLEQNDIDEIETK